MMERPNQPKLIKKRVARKNCEKRRRDKMNCSFSQMIDLLPELKNSYKRLDKLCVLRLSTNYLRFHEYIANRTHALAWLPEELSQCSGESLLKALDAFLFVLDKLGRILYMSSAAGHLLNQNTMDLIGLSFDNIIHPDDAANTSIFSGHSDTGSAPRHSFYIRLRQRGAQRQQDSYRLYNINGILDSNVKHGDTNVKPVNGNTGNTGNTDLVFIGVAKLVQRNPRMLAAPLIENLFEGRVSVDGRLLPSSDQSAQLVCGRVGMEIRGDRYWQFIHPGDVEMLAMSHQIVLKRGHLERFVHRASTSEGKYLYIQSSAHLVCGEWTADPQYVISISSFIDETLGRQMMTEQRKTLALEWQSILAADQGTTNEADSTQSDGDNGAEKLSDTVHCGGHSYSEISSDTVHCGGHFCSEKISDTVHCGGHFCSEISSDTVHCGGHSCSEKISDTVHCGGHFCSEISSDTVHCGERKIDKNSRILDLHADD